MTINAMELSISSMARISETETAGSFMSPDDGQRQFGGMLSNELNRIRETQQTITGHRTGDVLDPESGQAATDTSLNTAQTTGNLRAGAKQASGSGKAATQGKTSETAVAETGTQWAAKQIAGSNTLEVRGHGLTGEFGVADFFKFLTASLAGDLSGLNGSDWIAELKQFIAASGQSFQDISVGVDGIEALKELLVKAGFARADLEDMLSMLQADSQDGTLTLSSIFEGLSGLEVSSDPDLADPDDAMLLPISLLPAIQSMLSTFGIPEAIIGGVISDINVDGQGIDLDLFIDKLRAIQSVFFAAGQGTEQGIKEFGKVLEQLGFPSQALGSKTIGFNDILGFFEALRQEKRLSASLDRIQGSPTLQEGNSLAGLAAIRKISGNDDRGAGSLLAGTSVFEAVSDSGTQGSARWVAGGGISDLLQTLTRMPGSDDSSSTEGLLNTFLTSLTSTRTNDRVFHEDILGGNIQAGFLSLIQANSVKTVDRVSALTSFATTGSAASTGDGGDSLAAIKTLASFFETSRIDSQTGLAAKTSTDKGESGLVRSAGQMVVEALEASSSMDAGFKGVGMGSQQALAASKTRAVAQMLPSYVTNQVGKSLIRSINRGDSELRLQLKPPELGRLIMTIDTHGDSLRVSVLTESQAARDILSSHSLELKSALAGSGISLESFDVEMDKNFQQSMADARYQSSGSRSGGNRNRHGSTGSDTDVDKEIISALDDTRDNGVLHFVA